MPKVHAPSIPVPSAPLYSSTSPGSESNQTPEQALIAQARRRFRRVLIACILLFIAGVLLFAGGIVLMAFFIPQWNTDKRFAAIVGISLFLLGFVVVVTVLSMALCLYEAYRNLSSLGLTPSREHLNKCPYPRQKNPDDGDDDCIIGPGSIYTPFT